MSYYLNTVSCGLAAAYHGAQGVKTLYNGYFQGCDKNEKRDQIDDEIHKVHLALARAEIKLGHESETALLIDAQLDAARVALPQAQKLCDDQAKAGAANRQTRAQATIGACVTDALRGPVAISARADADQKYATAHDRRPTRMTTAQLLEANRYIAGAMAQQALQTAKGRIAENDAAKAQIEKSIAATQEQIADYRQKLESLSAEREKTAPNSKYLEKARDSLLTAAALSTIPTPAAVLLSAPAVSHITFSKGVEMVKEMNKSPNTPILKAAVATASLATGVGVATYAGYAAGAAAAVVVGAPAGAAVGAVVGVSMLTGHAAKAVTWGVGKGYQAAKWGAGWITRKVWG